MALAGTRSSALEAALQQAMAQLRAGQPRQAELTYRGILKSHPDHPHANHNLGAIAMQMGLHPHALPFFERAVAADPAQPQFRFSLAECWYVCGEWEAATEVLDQAAASGLVHAKSAQLRSAMADDADANDTPGRGKVFCIGRNKTGTTSLEAALSSLGFRMGLQARGEVVGRDWPQRDFRRLFQLCRTADAFQDAPFSRPYTFQALDLHFPGSKFILTVRDSAEQWYESVISFNTKIVNKGRLPSAADLKAFEYRRKGHLWEAAQMTYGITEETLYDKDIYIAHYQRHNACVIDYFRFRPGDLLVLNVAEPGAMQALCAFLGLESDGKPMPHMNASR